MKSFLSKWVKIITVGTFLYTWAIFPDYKLYFYFIMQFGILFPKLFWPSGRKNNVLVTEKNFWPSICKIFEITRKIYSNSERSEQFLKQNDFLTYFWRFFRSNTLEQIEFKLEKCRKSLKIWLVHQYFVKTQQRENLNALS